MGELRHVLRSAATGVVAAVLIVGSGALPAQAMGRWRVVPAPTDPGASLDGVVAFSSRDVWTVGGDGSGIPLAEHWNGKHWSRVPTAPLSGDGYFGAVGGSGANDVWAVGNWQDPTEPEGELDDLAEHWDGTAWTQIPFPSEATGHECAYNRVFGVQSLSPENAWAVGGFDYCGSDGGGFVAHWDGSSWTIVRGATDYVEGVGFVRPSLGWAVGGHFDFDAGYDTPLVLRWDGTSWSHTILRVQRASFISVAAVSSRDAWAVGGAAGAIGRGGRPLIAHWNGRAWRLVTVPAHVPGHLSGVTARGPDDVWAVGQDSHDHTLILHWNGASWTREASPAGALPSSLASAATDGTHAPWAVGQDAAGPLILRRG